MEKFGALLIPCVDDLLMCQGEHENYMQLYVPKSLNNEEYFLDLGHTEPLFSKLEQSINNAAFINGNDAILFDYISEIVKRKNPKFSKTLKELLLYAKDDSQLLSLMHEVITDTDLTIKQAMSVGHNLVLYNSCVYNGMGNRRLLFQKDYATVTDYPGLAISPIITSYTAKVDNSITKDNIAEIRGFQKSFK